MQPFSTADIKRLAELQCACIPESLVSQLGQRYAESFYRYVSQSAREKLLVLREAGQIASTAVVTLEPQSIRRRLLLHTSLVLFAGPWLLKRLLRKRRAGNVPNGPQRQSDPIPAYLPELLLLFTAPELRSRGLGAVLIGELEKFLVEERIAEYLVRTLDDPENRALKFYAALGFVPIGRTTDHGEVFRVFKRTLR